MENLFEMIVAGIIGTVVMSFFMYLFGFISRNEMKMIGVLGTMLTFQTSKRGKLSNSTVARLTGTLVHYLLGITFAIIYLFLWSKGIGRPDFIYGIIFGFVGGFIVFLVFKLLFAIHPNPPSLSVNSYFITIILAHIVYTLTVVFAYQQLRY